MRKIDLTGQKFGRLTVINQAEHYISPQGVKVIRWNCVCECGNHTVVSANQLRRGKTVSCGCYHKEQEDNRAFLQSKDIAGQQFGTLTAIRVVGGNERGRALWECKCTCGATVIKDGAGLRCGNIKSCGDRRKHASKHCGCVKGRKERLYQVFDCMKDRCYNQNSQGYKNYGGRGIKICAEWLSNYGAFREWAYANGYKEEVLPNGVNKWTIERIDVNGDYEPDNCTWITTQKQQFNKRDNVVLTYKGKTMTATEWAHELKLSPSVVWARIKHGWSVEETLSTPKLKSRYDRKKAVSE